MGVIAVTGTGSLIGQGILKCLRKSKFHGKVKCVGFDYFADTIGSHWCDVNEILPDPFKGSATVDEWVDRLCEVLIREKVTVVFVGIDFELPVLAERKKEIFDRTGARVMVSDSRVIDISNDKYETSKFLEAHGHPFPKSYLPKDIDHMDLDYPMIVKPRAGARSIGLHLVKNREELDAAIASVEEPVIQEAVGSMDEEYTCGVVFIDGEVKATIPLRRTLKAGNTERGEFRFAYHERLNDFLTAVTLDLQPEGCVNFQLRFDNEGNPKIFEINARHSGTTHMRTLFGLNEVEILLSHLWGEETDKIQLSEGVATRYFEEILLSN